MKKKEELYSCSQQDHNAMAETDIKMVPIADLHDFEGHPFKVENDMALFELMQSIEKEGVIVPALARPRAEGGYELIAGHRRKAASKWAGLDVMPVVIRELDDNQAVIAMVDSNLQREHLKPSEKAFAYKMKLDAMKRQGARTDLTFCQVGEKLENPTLQTHSLAGGYDADGKWMLLQDKSVEDAIIRSNQSLAMQTGESQRQISRYIRLTNLIPIITCSAVAIYDINADCVVKKIKIMTWPISNQEYEAQNENSEYFNRFKDGVIYKVLGRLQYSTFGELAFLYVKEVLEENVSGTKLDKKQEKYLAPIVLEDDVLGKLVLEKSEGLFEGTYHFLGNDITIYIEVEWSSKATWKKPLAVARDFVEHIVSRDEAFREYIAADEWEQCCS